MTDFEATIEEGPRGGALVAVPSLVVEALGGAGRIPVQAEFEGVPYRGSVVRMGGEHVIGLLKEIRQQLGKEPGDRIRVSLERDTEERRVEVPEEVARALAADSVAKEKFASLSYTTHQREHARHVAEARKPETRERRAAKTARRCAAARSLGL